MIKYVLDSYLWSKFILETILVFMMSLIHNMGHYTRTRTKFANTMTEQKSLFIKYRTKAIFSQNQKELQQNLLFEKHYQKNHQCISQTLTRVSSLQNRLQTRDWRKEEWRGILNVMELTKFRTPKGSVRVKLSSSFQTGFKQLLITLVFAVWYSLVTFWG